MNLQPGRMVAHYRLVELIGEGGMGVVWRASDTKLGRDVAVKILPENFAAEKDRMARFEREAKLLAALNQSNIAAIYGIEHADGLHLLAMELVEGEDLAQRIARGPIPVAASVDIGRQIAQALETAHDSGIIHRDLKPANVRITPDGQVKVLDFGLAKGLDRSDGPAGDLSRSPTITSGGTRAGLILGTVAYMSPEQARGQAVDRRCDIWALGCVLFECLTGCKAFGSGTVSDSLAAILRSEPEWSLLPAETPPRLRELLQRLLAKELRDRQRDIGDARHELERIAAGSAGGHAGSVAGGMGMPVPDRLRVRRWPVYVAAAAAVAGALAGAAITGLWKGSAPARSTASPSATHVSVSLPENMTLRRWEVTGDNRSIVAHLTPRSAAGAEGVPMLHTRSLDSFDFRPVPGTERIGPNWALSPDGRWAAFSRPDAPGSTRLQLYRVPLDGSSMPTEVAEWYEDAQRLDWHPSGEIITMVDQQPAATQRLIRISAEGKGAVVEVDLEHDEGTRFSSGDLLPGGRHILSSVSDFRSTRWEQHAGIVDLETGRTRILVRDAAWPQWSSTGHIVFSRHDRILAVPFDKDTLEVTGVPVAVTGGVRTPNTYFGAHFELNSSGTLAYVAGGVVGADRSLVLLDEDGEQTPWSETTRAFEGGLSVSRDGSRLAVGIVSDTGYYEVWTSPVARPRLSRLMARDGQDCMPQALSSDGESLVSACLSPAAAASYLQATGSTDARPLFEYTTKEGGIAYIPRAFTADGDHLILDVLDTAAGQTDVHLFSLADAVKKFAPGETPPTRRLVESAGANGLSADGRWLASVSSSSGRNELQIRPYNDGKIGDAIQITTGGVSWSAWSSAPGDSVLYYRSSDSVLAVTVSGDPDDPEISKPQRVPAVTRFDRLVGDPVPVPDGRFLVVRAGADEKEPEALRLEFDWAGELRSLSAPPAASR